MLKGIIFDMDGVITNTMPYHFDAWVKTLADIGIKANCYDIYLREGQDGISTLRDFCKKNHKPFDQKRALAILAKKEALFKKIVRSKFIKGARPFIRRMSEQGIALALVTGTSRLETEKILPKSIFKLFDVSITGNEVNNSKPHPEPFLRAVKKLKIPKKDLVVIENAPFGIESAKRAKLFCIALETSLPKKFLSKADIIVKSYKELWKIL